MAPSESLHDSTPLAETSGVDAPVTDRPSAAHILAGLTDGGLLAVVGDRALHRCAVAGAQKGGHSMSVIVPVLFAPTSMLLSISCGPNPPFFVAV